MAVKSLLNVRIRTKIWCGFLALVIVLSSVFSFVTDRKFRVQVFNEFLTRIESDASSFMNEISLNLIMGDTEAVNKSITSRLRGSDLVGVLVFDVGVDGWMYQATDKDGNRISAGDAESQRDHLLKELGELAVTFRKKDQKYESQKETSNYTDFAKTLESSEQFGYGTNIRFQETVDIQGSKHLVFVSSAFDEGATSSAHVFLIYSLERLDTIIGDNRWMSLLIVVLGSLISILLGLALGNYIVRPINDVVEIIKDLAEGEGDLSVRLNSSTNDEIGDLCKWFNTFVGKLNDLIGRMDTTSHLLNKQLANLNQNIELLHENVDKTDTTFHAVAQVGESLQVGIDNINLGTETSHAEMEKVASGSETMSSNISEVSTSVQSAVRNLAEVASAVEELSATLQEISRNMEHCSKTTLDATELSKTASDSVRILDEHARNISDFVSIIDAISKQTNLLALNATIEAASAGEAGKGFAVVANEVKDLAKQTAQAVQQIAHRVSEIQQSTNTVIEANDRIATVMNEVSSINTGIVATIEEQASTVQEIHRNLDNTSSESEAISQSIQSSLEISIEVRDACQEAFKQASSVLTVTRDILEHSKLLAEKSEEAKSSSAEMVDALGSSTSSVSDLSNAAQSMLAITNKFKLDTADGN
ncbi:methyl-accepting chemotaxis protein [Acanthopleuribacter pedis]|uniref:HAMP domain-containing protein n=1 Tax=Acanthopleuribacter pedis TaxID=442870 RepID=A0A8J7QML7_9BACT|nr:HAMP domain-containing methyl-accepting chemotaxis protein [Acanthopleuribacter pedis]MBO1321173.1 HAMP domain-containing protein [Acanthopleuribacter pedis]